MRARQPVVITIARDYGAEGHEIGKMLSMELGIPLYDNELLWSVPPRAQRRGARQGGRLRRAYGCRVHGVPARSRRFGAHHSPTACSNRWPR
ncbi:MAG: cytidylate kinase family protein [Collinsella sp.]